MTRDRHEMAGVILSGGKNLRMGQNKAFLKIEGVPIIERIFDLFQTLFREIVIVTNENEREFYHAFDAKVCTDLVPGSGALGGLYTGLFHSSFFHSFVVACDMPYLNRSVINYLIQRKEGYDVILPKTEDGLEPLHAIYSKNCVPPIRRLLEENKSRIIDVFPFVRVNVVDSSELLPLDPDMESFINLNTPDDLRHYRKRDISHD